ncbi:uncharacterized protein LOC142164015 [Nicotiana tabacum]|uniref:Uncharacterized protein LOC142164015 n=1 Tax=Nicotiana tabacum TaxID=4097 RepID=A0AC58RX41_TOBAC
MNTTLIGEEKELSKTYHILQLASELYLRQKTKVQWLTQGDQNTKVFHNFMKARRNENMIFSIRGDGGQIITNIEGIARAFVGFYTELLGTKNDNRAHVCNNLVRADPTVNEEQRIMVEADFTNSEVKQELWDIDGEKHQGQMDMVATFSNIVGGL